MPYKDPNKQRDFQKKWVRSRRAKVFKGKKCALCGKPISSSTGEFDHKTAKKGNSSSNENENRIYSWTKERQKKELSKGRLLCKACHKKKTKKDLSRVMSKDGKGPKDEGLFRDVRIIQETVANLKEAVDSFIESADFFLEPTDEE